MNGENERAGGFRPSGLPIEASAMYRIRLASGAETTYHSMEEFAAALQDGAVTADAVIYHQRADRWLAVTNHPHYQIALSRPSSAVSAADASKRQVISAVRPAGEVPATRVSPRTEVPPTAARAQIHQVVAQLEAQSELKAPRKLAIPQPAAKTGNGHANGTGAGQKTSVLPLRTPVKLPVAAESNIPDLGEGLDLVEEISPAVPAAVRPSTATPQVDKLLEMLDPMAHVAPPAKAPVRHQPEVELIDLNAPLRHKAPILEIAAPAQHQHEHHHAPVTYRRKKSPKMIGLAVAAVLVMGIAVVLWKPWSGAGGLPEGSEIASTTLPRTEAFGGSTSGPAPTAQNNGTESPAAAAPVDSTRVPAKPVDSAPSIVRVAAPRNIGVSISTTNLVATGGPSRLSIGAGVLIQHYNAAYTEARSELELRMLQIGFTQIFLRSRLSTGAGVQDTRRLIASASTALRQYRSQETQIERAYQDTVGAAGRNLAWTPRDLGSWNTKAGLKESGETLRLTNLMLSQMDSTFSLLAEQEGKFQVSGDAISFENPEAGRQYGALRVWLNQQADKYAGTGDALPATLRQVVKAIGSTRLPQERR